MTDGTAIALSSEVQALARAITTERDRPALPAAAVTVLLHSIEPLDRAARTQRAQELLALAIRLNRELADRAGEVVSQLLFAAGLVLGDQAR